MAEGPDGMAVAIEELTSLDEVASLAPAWNRLLAESSSDTIFLTYEWVLAYLRWIARGATPMVLVARDGDDLVGIAPLMVTERSEGGSPVRRVEFIGVPNSDYSDFIARGDDPVVLQAFFRHILSRRRQWYESSLTELPQGS